MSSNDLANLVFTLLIGTLTVALGILSAREAWLRSHHH